jgi:hypothetical protein
MNFREFHDMMLSFVIFSYEDIKGVFGSIDRRRIHEWAQKGYIHQIIKGYYLFREFRDIENLGFLISNKIYEPSYLSMEFVLSSEGVIPEAVYTFTAVGTRKTSSFSTPFGDYYYHSIKNNLFSGYELKKLEINLNGRVLERFVRVACLEKAFFDFFYFRRRYVSDNDIPGFRFDPVVLSRINKNRLYDFISLSGNRKIEITIMKILNQNVIT